ncbi:type I-G CRISPR-associated protein Csb2 [Actinomadura sp. 3N407]|uniref:type I-G CRISPR-associated protein Csb2 n=1 Tax=Actinomadura sp. 3N407 TaxID=3457423 RepID=UPI003FCCCE90
MPVVITARLREGRYEAAAVRPQEAEWPPHPARLFCALVASARDEADRTVLRWLEAAGAPEVWASGRAGRESQAGYVVTNAVSGKGGSQSWPGRTNGHKARATAVPDDPEFAVVWQQATPDMDTLCRLAALAHRVPYLGRATSPVTLTVSGTAPERRPTWVVFMPTLSGERFVANLRVPYPGYLDQLDRVYQDGGRAWEVGRPLTYRRESPEPVLTPSGPFQDLIVFGCASKTQRPPGDRLLTLTSTLRKAVMQRLGTDLPAQVHGHGANGHHVGYLALPDVAHPHADGHILGVALALPRDMNPQDADQVLAAVVDDPLSELAIGQRRPLRVEYDPYRTHPKRLDPDWWAAAPDGARRWVTATSVMLDRYPKSRDTPFEMIAESFVCAGYPRPKDIEIAPAPLMRGALNRPQPGTFPPGRPRRKLLHVRVEFEQPQMGPVIVGSMRYLGLGLFAPERSSR